VEEEHAKHDSKGTVAVKDEHLIRYRKPAQIQTFHFPNLLKGFRILDPTSCMPYGFFLSSFRPGSRSSYNEWEIDYNGSKVYEEEESEDEKHDAREDEENPFERTPVEFHFAGLIPAILERKSKEKACK